MTTTITIDWTLVIAVYAAIVATLAIGWDVYKWLHAGPNLEVTLNTGMKAFNIPEYEGKKLMMLYVTNRGDRPTTITHYSIHQYVSWLTYIRRRAKYSAVVMHPNTEQPPPYILNPGATWIGIALQTADIEKMAAEGRLYVALTHSHAKKSMRLEVKLE